ncbi:gliding motility-associated ABC transporter ATP-binding subunit GldA [bacterium]|nr:gliding motility-associated ABC transporter ATP-binding subunit GldA [bacterium]
MSIELKNLTKNYGEQIAVNEISFEIKTGEIVGFLGPNGAGKSTTMKILAGYIPQTSGIAKVCGIDVNEHPLEVKKQIGYLPEHNPLYLDMYVSEFLDFTGRIAQISNRKSRVDEVIEMTGLVPERKKQIAQLSKGYRQRVGLAQALIHEPKVLILDEPTSGLDPNQVLEIRKLISTLGQDRTVMLSTHIMQEVEAMCNRVVIINKGKIVADDETSKVSERVRVDNVVNVKFKKQISTEKLKQLKGIIDVEQIGEHKYRVRAQKQTDLPELLFKFAVDSNTIILEQNTEKVNLESVFQKLTRNV